MKKTSLENYVGLLYNQHLRIVAGTELPIEQIDAEIKELNRLKSLLDSKSKMAAYRFEEAINTIEDIVME